MMATEPVYNKLAEVSVSHHQLSNVSAAHYERESVRGLRQLCIFTKQLAATSTIIPNNSEK